MSGRTGWRGIWGWRRLAPMRRWRPPGAGGRAGPRARRVRRHGDVLDPCRGPVGRSGPARWAAASGRRSGADRWPALPGRRAPGGGDAAAGRPAGPRSGQAAGRQDPLCPRPGWRKRRRSCWRRRGRSRRSTRTVPARRYSRRWKRQHTSGWSASRAVLAEIAGAARATRAASGPEASATDLLLDGFAARATAGYPAAVPLLRRAIAMLRACCRQRRA